MIGTTLAHYRITAALGAGGMGEVWRAEDTKLGRDVALKVLSEEFADDAERLERFEREARAVAALNHPHIVTIFSVEEADGIRFLTMELINGKSLDQLIPDGGMELGPFFKLAIPLAEAISAAHDKSVIHRDLKPSNVMVDSDDRVKVLDFGLAKLQDGGEVSDSSELPTEALTGVGMIVGTVPYMSPEQIEGKIVDHRTDIFSLGILLYEMALGERPFQGDSQPALMSSILRDVPQSVVEVRDDVPRHLGRIIGRCLEKDRRDRYQTARDVFNELKALRLESTSRAARVSPSIAAPQRTTPLPSSSSAEVLRGDVPWLAVLPFGCASGDPDVVAFADGLEEDIATGLSRFSYLFVVARKSTRRYRGEATDIRQVGEELGARFVMEGGIRKAGSTIRINVQIVDTETGTHLWSETYDRDLDGTAIFTVQDDITDRVVATVADPYGVVARSMAIPTAAMDPREMTAYQAVLRYFLYQQRLSQEDHLIAREALERAVETEPGYADAWSCLALVVLDEDRHDFNRRPDALDRSLSAARRGVEADPASSFAHYALATVYFYRRDLGAFKANAEKAIRLNRRNGNVVAMLGVLYGYSGDWERGVELTTEAMKLNPHHPGWYRFTTFFDHFLKGEDEKALEVAQKINMPGYYAAPMVQVLAHTRLGNTAAAEDAVSEMLRAYPAEDMRGYGRFAEMWFYSQPDLLNEVISVLRSVGVRVDAPDGEVSTPAPVSSPSTPAASQIAAATETQRVAIAVLPFVNMSDDPGNEFFSDGVTEEILTNLSKIGGLYVISRTSAMAYKGTSKSIREIARELEVGSVLEGSVRRAGDRVRVTAKLIEAATDKHLWSESYDRDLEDIFEVQSEVAVEIGRALEAELLPEVVAQIRKRPTEDMKAYDLYLQGRQGARTLRAPEILRGIGQLEEAISLDPDFAAAHSELALAHLRSAYWGAARGKQDFEEARGEADRALDLDPTNAAAWVARAGVRCLNDLDWDGAVDDFREAIRLDLNEVEAHHWLGMTLFLMGRFDDAVAAQEAALSLDPQSPNVSSHLGLALCFSGRQEEGLRMLLDGFDQHPVFFDFPNFLAIVHKMRDNFAEASKWYDRACQLTGHHPAFEAMRASTLVLAGAETEARRLLVRFNENGDDSRVDSIARATAAMAEFNLEEAIRHFHRAADQRLPLVYWYRAVMHERELPADDPGVRALWSRLWPDSPAANESHVRIRQTPLIGRDAERETLDRMLEEVAKCHGGLVLLGGEPGVGKTRLATEILEDGRARGMLALTGHAYEDETAPFVTSTEILEEMVRLVPADDLRRMLGNNASELARLLPELRTIYDDISEPADVPPELLQRHLFKNVLEFLTRAGSERPMVMLLDDIHWADESSLLLLEHITPRLTELPILMIGTYRDVEADIGKPFARSMTTLVRQRQAERITVRPFDEESVADVLTALGGFAPPASLAHAIHDATEGNVFFIEETFRHLSEEGLLFDETGAWRADIDVEHLNVPEGVRLVTARRIERLSESTQKILSLASVIGLRFGVRVLEAASSDADAVLDALEEAEAAQLLKPAAGDHDLRYEFVHALARQTLLSELSPLRQQRMHLAIADAIERTSGSEPERRAADIAHHFVEAGSSADPERVVRWLMAAGENAVAATAMEEAVDIFDKALSMAGIANQDVRAQLLRMRGPARLGLGDSEGFQADLFEAFTIYESRQRGEVVAETASELAYILIWTAQSDRAHDVVSRALDLVGEAESRERCRLLSAQGLAHSMGREPGDPGAARRCHEAAVEMARQVGDPRLLAEALQNQAMGYWHRLEGGGRRPAHEAASIQREAKREWSLGNCLWLEKAALTLGGQFEEAAAIDEELRPLAERNANFGALGIMELMNSTIRRASGDLEGSSQALRRSREHFEAGGFPWGSFQDGYEAVNLLLRGKNEEARRALDTLGANLMEGAVYTGVDTAYWLSGKAHLSDSDILEQYRNYHSYVPERGRAMTAGALVFLKGSIEALVLAGERDEAAKLYPPIADFVQRNMGLFDFAFGLHERFAGMAAAAGRDWEAADRHFKKALELAEDLPHRVDQARVRFWYARMLLDRREAGDGDRAREILATARNLSEDMGLHGLIDQIDTLRGESGSAAEETDHSGTLKTASIAVLPFVNMSADPENEYFSDGLSEEIINALTRIQGLRVIARTSAFRFRGEQDLRMVGEALGVETLLEGSVRKAGERLRITAQLIDVTGDSHVWSERFDRELTDVFEIQDEIAGAIVEKLGVSLAADEPVRRQTANVEAYDALLEGRHHFSQFTPEAVERALACFERALSLDPEYADALAFYGFYHLMKAYMFENPREMLPKTREFAEKALQVDSNHGEAQAAVAVVAVMLDQDWSANDRLFQGALEMAPASARVHELYGLCCLLGRGRFDEALAELDLALKLDPLSALYAGNRGRVLTCARRFAEAEESCRRGLVLDSRQLLVQVELTYALLFDGKLEEAIAVGERAIATHGPVNAPRQALALSYAVAGRRHEAFELVTDEPGEGYRSPLARGLVHAAFDEMDEAFTCVEQSFEERDPLLIYINVHPMFDTLRADPRFATLVERVGLPGSPGGPTASMDSRPSQHVEKSIVVLPFDNLSPDPDTEYFSDGLTDEIITDLSGVRALRVISRSSAMRLKGDERDLAAISRDLDCRYVLEGSVRRAADTLRITARLVDAPNDDQLWADKYGGTLDDVFDIQERVSRSIVDALEIRLTPQEAQQLSERPIPDVRAQECYLLARREIWSFLPGSLERAISHLEAGISLIGDNALLYQGLGEAYFQSINIGAAGGREEEYIEKAESCAEKIFALEPESPGGYSVRAHLQLARGDIHGCGRSWRRVLQAFPKDVQALQLSAHILGWLAGKPDAAMPLVVRLLDIDPLDPMSRLASVTVPLFAGRFEEALEPGRRMFDLDPVTPVWRSNYVMALSYNQRLDEAEALTEGVVAEPDSDIGTWWMGLWRAAWREDRAEVLRLADGPYQQAAAWDAEIPWVLASAHAAVGATEEALLWLDRAIDRGMINYPFLSEHDRYLDNVRSDKRFGQAMEKARREWERFDV